MKEHEEKLSGRACDCEQCLMKMQARLKSKDFRAQLIEAVQVEKLTCYDDCISMNDAGKIIARLHDARVKIQLLRDEFEAKQQKLKFVISLQAFIDKFKEEMGDGVKNSDISVVREGSRIIVKAVTKDGIVEAHYNAKGERLRFGWYVKLTEEQAKLLAGDE